MASGRRTEQPRSGDEHIALHLLEDMYKWQHVSSRDIQSKTMHIPSIFGFLYSQVEAIVFNYTLRFSALDGRSSASSSISATQSQFASSQNITLVPKTFLIRLQLSFCSDLQPEKKFAKTAPGSETSYHLYHHIKLLGFFLFLFSFWRYGCL